MGDCPLAATISPERDDEFALLVEDLRDRGALSCSTDTIRHRYPTAGRGLPPH